MARHKLIELEIVEGAVKRFGFSMKPISDLTVSSVRRTLSLLADGFASYPVFLRNLTDTVTLDVTREM